MTKTSLLASTALLLSLAIAPAHAQTGTTIRTFLSGTGTDTGTCPLNAPCRTLGYAITQQAPNGQMILLDTAGYGTVTITHSVSILSEGHISLINTPTGDGITINAGASDSIVLRGLTFDGLHTGSNGIVFNSGGSLTIDKCNALNFVASGGTTGVGILLQPASGSTPKIAISDTNSSNNANTGIWLSGASSAKVQIDHVVTNSNNQNGLVLYGSSSAAFNVTSSIASNNGNQGLYVTGPSTTSLDSLIATGNGTGIFMDGTAYLGRSVVSGNYAYGLRVTGTTYSYRNNQINGNANDLVGTLTTAALQ